VKSQGNKMDADGKQLGRK